MWKIRKVKGKTMTPALIPGAVVVTTQRMPRVGDVVLAQNADGEILKRVIDIKGKEVTLANDHGTPHMERLSHSAILGVVSFSLPGAVMAPRPHKPFARAIATICALFFIIMATSQLFAFDKFIELLDANWVPHGINGAFLGAVLVSLTVLALPYLLHMALSPAARLLSQLSGWVTSLLWIGIGFMTISVGQSQVSTGILGGLVDTPPGVWLVIFAFLLFGLVVASSWALGGTRYVQEFKEQ